MIPALDEEASIGDVVERLRARAAWREILVVDDGSRDATADRARAAGARVIRHPYTKGNGAAVKSGSRSATGDFILIIDADGQHPPDDALRLAARLGEYDLVVGARAPSTQATLGRRGGNALLNGLAGYLTGRPIPDLTSGFRGARRTCLREFLHLLPNGFSTPTTTTLTFLKAGYNVAFEPAEAATREGESKIRLARDGVPLTMCPVSNLRLGVVADLARHPLKAMLEAGLKVTVNADDPAYFGAYVADNYLGAARALGLDRTHIATLARNSIEAAFLAPAERAALLATLDAFLAREPAA